MSGDEIVKLTCKLRKMYRTRDPFYLCSLANITVRRSNFNPNAIKAYCTTMCNTKSITINKAFTYKSQKIFCAHELGHIIMHDECYCEGFGDNDQQKEYEANLFAVALLFDQQRINVKFENMSAYDLQTLLYSNIEVIQST